jgi:hypothetical protein
MKLFRMACCDLVDPDPLGHELYKVRHHVLPTQDALDTSPNRVGFFVRNLAQVNGAAILAKAPSSQRIRLNIPKRVQAPMEAYSTSKINNHHSTIIHPAMEKPRAMAISPARSQARKQKRQGALAPCLGVSLNAYTL